LDVRPEVVVITGASAGVGRAIVRRFAREGAHIGLLARGVDGLEGARTEVEEAGGRALALPTDVSDAAQVEAAAERVERELGPIDIWINDAMTTIFAPFLEITPEEYRRATEVTYLGFVWGTMAALRRMVPRDRGVVVQVGSALAYRSIPLQSPYCGAKHAIRGFTDSIRCELLHAKSNVHLTMVQLPAMNTPQFDWCRTRLPRHPQPVPPIYQPEVAAEGIYYAAHHRRREMTVGAPTPIVIQANKVVPGLGDLYLAENGFDSQQTDQPVEPDRPNNLFAPLPGDRGAHGSFGAQAKPASTQLAMNMNRGWMALAAVGAGVLAGALVSRSRRTRASRIPERLSFIRARMS
jgi:NAD(P)-dependent dehydrogenase (short-subunit alcohol dehydrogenase family)